MPNWTTQVRITILALAICFTGIAASAFAFQPASDTERAGQNIPTNTDRPQRRPDDVRRFRPAESNAIVAADAISLKAVLDQLGPDVQTWYQHVMTLSNPFFEGRGPGTRGMEVASEYIEFYMQQAGLDPAFPSTAGASEVVPPRDRTSFRQPFDFPRPGGTPDIVTADLRFGGKTYQNDKDFTVFGISGSGEVTAPLSFVGYGIEEGPDGYSSFSADSDLSGRIALLLRYEPLGESGLSRWAPEGQRFSGKAPLRPKISAVAERHPAAIILVNPPGMEDAEDKLIELEQSSRYARRPLEVPIIQVKAEVADAMIRAADPAGGTLMDWRRKADAGEVATVNFPERAPITIRAEVLRPRLETENVAGVLRGRGPLADEWIVIGAHFDHVGYGYTGIRSADNRGKLHPGADDNASGTASLLMLADKLSAAYSEDDAPNSQRSILFIAFSAEEAGLIGSNHFVDHSPIDLTRVSLMLNMDMVGRLRNGELHVGGTGTAVGMMDWLQPHFGASGLNIAASESGTGPSDHSVFNRQKIPVLFMFTGLHDEYHTPEDLGHTVNPLGGVAIMNLAYSILLDAARQPSRLRYADAGSGEGRDRGYGPVRLGIRPGMGEADMTGVLIEEVSEDTSAAKAGIQPGDVLLKWNEVELYSLRDLFEQLQNHKPGDRVNITLRRGSETIMLPVVLQASEAPRE